MSPNISMWLPSRPAYHIFQTEEKKNTPHPAMMLPHDTLPWTDIHNAIKYEGTRPTSNGQATENLYIG